MQSLYDSSKKRVGGSGLCSIHMKPRVGTTREGVSGAHAKEVTAKAPSFGKGIKPPRSHPGELGPTAETSTGDEYCEGSWKHGTLGDRFACLSYLSRPMDGLRASNVRRRSAMSWTRMEKHCCTGNLAMLLCSRKKLRFGTRTKTIAHVVVCPLPDEGKNSHRCASEDTRTKIFHENGSSK